MRNNFVDKVQEQTTQIKVKQISTPSQKVQSSLNFLQQRKRQILSNHLNGITLKNIQERVLSKSNSKKKINQSKICQQDKLINTLNRFSSKNQFFAKQQETMKRSFLRYQRQNSKQSLRSNSSRKKRVNSLAKLQLLLDKQNNEKQVKKSSSYLARKGSQKQLRLSRQSSSKSIKSISETSSLAQSRALLLNSIAEKIIQSKHVNINIGLKNQEINDSFSNKQNQFKEGYFSNRSETTNHQHHHQSKEIFDRLQKLQTLIIEMAKPQNEKRSKKKSIQRIRVYKQSCNDDRNKSDQTYQVMLKQIMSLKDQIKLLKNSRTKIQENTYKLNQQNESQSKKKLISINKSPSKIIKVDTNNCDSFEKPSYYLNNQQNKNISFPQKYRYNTFHSNQLQYPHIAQSVAQNYNIIGPSSYHLNQKKSNLYQRQIIQAPGVNNNIFSNINQNFMLDQRYPYHINYQQKIPITYDVSKQRANISQNNFINSNLIPSHSLSSQKQKINFTFGLNQKQSSINNNNSFSRNNNHGYISDSSSYPIRQSKWQNFRKIHQREQEKTKQISNLNNFPASNNIKYSLSKKKLI